MNTFKPLSKIEDKDRYERIFNTLVTSIYPGAKYESAEMVIEYCNSLKLDPMMKPVHIVPMSVKDSRSGDFTYRDVIMPGIGLYRIIASRSQKYLGITKPEFGKDVTEELDGVKVIYPEWCLLYIKLKVNGEIVEIPSLVYWKEAYATANSKTIAPNKMWLKRPRGQLIKCTEANAYRMAFPDTLGSMVTYEEVEGKIQLSKDLKILDELPIGGNEKLRKVIDITTDENSFSILDIINRIEKINDLKELDKLGKEIKDTDLSEDQIFQIRETFKIKKQELKNKLNGINSIPIAETSIDACKNTLKGNNV